MRYKKFFLSVIGGVLLLFIVSLFYGYFFISPFFYHEPSDFSSKPPGTILRTEKVAQDVLTDANVWKILYVSTDFQTKKPIVVSGMVYIPTAAATKRPIVAWAHGTTGVATQCAPSLLANGGLTTIPGLATFIKTGYVVVATDYPGLGTAGTLPYLIGESEAYAVLDGVRAVLNLPQANAENKFVVWGHSQGGHASLFSGEFAQTYSPELHLVGIAATAPPTNLPQLFAFDLGTAPGDVLASLAFVSWSKLFANAKLSDILQLDAIAIAKSVASRCVDNKYALMVDSPESALFKLGFLSKNPSNTEPWQTIMQTNSPTGSAISVPMLITQGTEDVVVHKNVTDAFVQNACNEGKTVMYHVLPGVGHLPAGFDSVPIVLPWITERFNGVIASSNC